MLALGKVHAQALPNQPAGCLTLTAPWALLTKEVRAALAEQATQVPALCNQNAQHLVVLAWLALEAGDDFRALAQVERAVLIEPESPGIQLEYALLLSRLGQPSLAQAVVRQLLLQPNVPERLRQELDAWLADPFAWQRVTPGGATGPSHQSRFYVGFGGDTNVNNGLSADRIRLTLPSEVIEFPLDKREKAIAGNTLEWGGEGQWLFGANGSLGSQALSPPSFGLLVGLSGVQPLGRSSYASQSVQLAGRAFAGGLEQAGLYHALGRPIGLELRVAGSWYGQERLVQTVGTSLAWGLDGFDLNWGQAWRCQPELGLGADARRYPNSPVFDHLAFNLAWGSVCNAKGQELRFGVHANTEQPRNQRPGGVSQRLGLTSSLGLPMPWGRLNGQLQLEYEADNQTYSTLLKDGARKETLLLLAGLVATRPVTQTTRVYGRLESRRQQSNLPLFSSNSFFVGMGLEATFR